MSDENLKFIASCFDDDAADILNEINGAFMIAAMGEIKDEEEFKKNSTKDKNHFLDTYKKLIQNLLEKANELKEQSSDELQRFGNMVKIFIDLYDFIDKIDFTNPVELKDKYSIYVQKAKGVKIAKEYCKGVLENEKENK